MVSVSKCERVESCSGVSEHRGRRCSGLAASPHLALAVFLDGHHQRLRELLHQCGLTAPLGRQHLKAALLQLRFRIDLSQLPKPLQIGAFGRSDWNLLVQQTQPLMLEQL